MSSFILFSALSLNQWCVLNEVPRGGAAQLIFQLSKKKLDAQLCSLRRSKLNTSSSPNEQKINRLRFLILSSRQRSCCWPSKPKIRKTLLPSSTKYRTHPVSEAICDFYCSQRACSWVDASSCGGWQAVMTMAFYPSRLSSKPGKNFGYFMQSSLTWHQAFSYYVRGSLFLFPVINNEKTCHM